MLTNPTNYNLYSMLITNKLNTPGEHQLLFPGAKGLLEVVINIPINVDKRYIAIIGHPHPLHGGTMNNKVVTTLVRVFKDLNLASIRFNFRGVGKSEGSYDEGLGESEDLLILARACLNEITGVKLLFAGFSFGSYVAYRAASLCESSLLISVAPPVHHYDFQEFKKIPTPWIVAQGDDDELVSLQLVLDFIEKIAPPITLIRFNDTDHFFHGKLIELKTELITKIRENVVAI